jgi:hypothetical protein
MPISPKSQFSLTRTATHPQRVSGNQLHPFSHPLAATRPKIRILRKMRLNSSPTLRLHSSAPKGPKSIARGANPWIHATLDSRILANSIPPGRNAAPVNSQGC